jgi:hypothetical protein
MGSCLMLYIAAGLLKEWNTWLHPNGPTQLKLASALQVLAHFACDMNLSVQFNFSQTMFRSAKALEQSLQVPEQHVCIRTISLLAWCAG